MANPYFQFKKFTIRHDKCAMKVGTDAVLLGAWTDTASCKNILDIGTGTGIIALMLAQRSCADIDAIDIDKEACVQAEENVAASPFAGRIKVIPASCADFARSMTQKKYDLIVSNPPYFINSLKCPDNKRSVARHTDSLPLSELIENARALLSSAGRIALVLPYEQLEEVRETAQKNSLHICRQTNVIPVPGAHPKRLLVELSPVSTDTKKRNTLTIEEALHQYTPEYIALTKDFYLKM
ncbi:MAG: tRNA1(Val) (adenine(37)-N6)-methyltransferase [Parabacteroides sp.]|nr:tRNA1(Val) (adenine(37)-N6)-methyltransferase [Parabacteroides sp.]